MLWGFVRIVAFRWARGTGAPSIIGGTCALWSKNRGGERRRRDVNPCGDRSKNFLLNADFLNKESGVRNQESGGVERCATCLKRSQESEIRSQEGVGLDIVYCKLYIRRSRIGADWVRIQRSDSDLMILRAFKDASLCRNLQK
jgi:hypothetical protein